MLKQENDGSTPYEVTRSDVRTNIFPAEYYNENGFERNSEDWQNDSAGVWGAMAVEQLSVGTFDIDRSFLKTSAEEHFTKFATTLTKCSICLDDEICVFL